MAKYDVLRAVGVAGGDLGFTANAAVVEVAVNAVTGSPVLFNNSNGDSWFLPGEGVLLQAIWPSLPYQFGQGAGIHSLGLVWTDGTVTADLSELESEGGVSAIYLPSACEPLQILEGNNPPGLLVRAPVDIAGDGSNNKVRLGINSVVLNVSMVNLPAVLDAGDFAVAYHLEVLHTLDLETAGP